MTGCLWIVEDHEPTIRALQQQYVGWEFKVCRTSKQALDACRWIADDDIVTVDSQLPTAIDPVPDPLAGQKLIAELRMQGSRSRVFWHSGGVTLDPEFSTDLAVETAAKAGLTHLTADRRPLPDDVVTLARIHRDRLQHRRIEYFNSLFAALQAYLFLRDLDSARDGITAPFNLVLEELGPALARTTFAQHEHAWSLLSDPLEDAASWFARPVRTALEAWRPEDRSLAAFYREFRPTPVITEVFEHGDCGPERWLKYSPLCDRSAGEVEATPASLYQGALQQLWQFCCSVQNAEEDKHDELNVDAAYRALQLISLLHYPFTKSRNLAERSVLSHQDLGTRLRVLFQRPGRTETDGGSPARTEAVLTNKVSLGTYPEIDEALQRWPHARMRIEQNIWSISTRIDPFCKFLHDSEEEFGWKWTAVLDLHSACIKKWLGIQEWASKALSALAEFDHGLDLVRKQKISMDELISRYDRFREVYSGRTFFNFQQTT